MLHEPAAQSGHDPAAPFKSKLGLWMFAFYFIFYAAFVAINLWKPSWMALKVLLGMNLATVYGFLLIIGALVQAVIYNHICHAKEIALAKKSPEGEVK
jgi:uncharacterized membrane protein (DUF485 family)